jgi:hypothetical protein
MHSYPKPIERLLRALNPYAQSHFCAFGEDLQLFDTSTVGYLQQRATVLVLSNDEDRRSDNIPWQ